MKASAEDVRHAYRLLLGREADEVGLSQFLRLIRDAELLPTEVAEYFFDSPEFRAKWPSLFSVSPGLSVPPPSVTALSCKPCTMKELESPVFRFWAKELRDRPAQPHRKLWEWCYIAQVLSERNLLREGTAGLGFAVGQEPLPSLFAVRGCRIVATDLNIDDAQKEGWVDGKQHAADIGHLNRRNICPPVEMAERTSFRTANMKAIPSNIGKFDFLWSSCAMEHLGSLRDGMDFVVNAMRCLKPGGVAVHTTEYNCDSDVETIEKGHDVIFRKRDFLQMEAELRELGHVVAPFDFELGNSPEDLYVDEPPYQGKVHLKLRIGRFASTSFGLIVKAGEG